MFIVRQVFRRLAKMECQQQMECEKQVSFTGSHTIELFVSELMRMANKRRLGTTHDQCNPSKLLCENFRTD